MMVVIMREIGRVIICMGMGGLLSRTLTIRGMLRMGLRMARAIFRTFRRLTLGIGEMIKGMGWGRSSLNKLSISMLACLPAISMTAKANLKLTNLLMKETLNKVFSMEKLTLNI
jgi:hypothetical protein